MKYPKLLFSPQMRLKSLLLVAHSATGSGGSNRNHASAWHFQANKRNIREESSISRNFTVTQRVFPLLAVKKGLVLDRKSFTFGEKFFVIELHEFLARNEHL